MPASAFVFSFCCWHRRVASFCPLTASCLPRGLWRWRWRRDRCGLLFLSMLFLFPLLFFAYASLALEPRLSSSSSSSSSCRRANAPPLILSTGRQSNTGVCGAGQLAAVLADVSGFTAVNPSSSAFALDSVSPQIERAPFCHFCCQLSFPHPLRS